MHILEGNFTLAFSKFLGVWRINDSRLFLELQIKKYLDQYKLVKLDKRFPTNSSIRSELIMEL